jgi:hypothetical protein
VGGSGSTRWGNRRRRPTVNDAPRIDVGKLRDALDGPADSSVRVRVRVFADICVDVLAVFDGSWGSSGTRLVRLVATRSLIGDFGVAGVEEVTVESIEKHLGGRQCLFVCPRCGQRRLSLYLDDLARRWTCRVCLGLAYESQRLRKLARLNARLRLMSRHLDPSIKNAVAFPPKPSRMRWATYMRRLREWEKIAGARDAIAIPAAHASIERLRSAPDLFPRGSSRRNRGPSKPNLGEDFAAPGVDDPDADLVDP